MTPAPYNFDSDHWQEDGGQYPYQDLYTPGQQPRRRGGGHGGWWVLAVLLALVVGVSVLLRHYALDVRQTENGVTFSIREAGAEPENAPAAGSGTEIDTAALLKPDAAAGGGTRLAVVPAPDALPATPAAPDGQGLSLQEIYKRVLPSVVSITAARRSGTASGTGIVMSGDGYIITNAHVIDSAVSIEVLTSDDRAFSAALVGSDETSDLAVLKVAAEGLTPAEFGDSDAMEVGDSVVAIGDPLGRELRGTMTNGIVSAINRNLVVNGRTMTLMQTNAALNNGNSGGPLVNAYGQVIGINTVKMSGYTTASATVEGLGFAIPIATAKPIVDELIAQGYVSGRPAIGISGRSLPAAVQSYYRLPSGVYIESVEPDSDACRKGIEVGDTITAIEGITVSTMDDLDLIKYQFEAGDTVNLTIYRAGEFYSVDVVLMDAAGR